MTMILTIMKSSFVVAVVAVAAAAVVTAACKKDPSNAETKLDATPAASASSSAVIASSEGPPCREDTNKKVYNGKLSSCLLAREHTINGYTCESGKLLEVYPDGKLKGCYMTGAKVIDGYSCKDGLSLYASGKLRRCKVVAAKKAGEGIEVRAGDWVTLYESGTMRRLELVSGPTKIQGMPCQGYLNYFHENGKLKKCELSEDATIEGKKVAARVDGGSVYVCFDDKGKRVPDCNLLSGMTMD